nr:ArdC family protein [Yersinia pestis]
MKKTSPSRRPAKARRERPDLYQQVTDSIIGAIERGTLPWRKPWRTDRNRIYTGSVMPQNGTTGYHYSGVNVLLLSTTDEK